ncbi:hypothetical protein GCM10023322_06740 [Rugosimonospora acidiphila]|uniref:Berberine and berberine like n=1 Tax=Rugosimonospora acidiphila TaxID=556531 RepID=A0ABP9RJ81_9ACTN
MKARYPPYRSSTLHALGVGGPDQAGAITSYAEELIRRLRPRSTGKQNVQYLTAADANPEGVRRAYDSGTLRRLVTVKRTYDADNMSPSSLIRGSRPNRRRAG